MKKIINSAHELYLIVSALFYWFSSTPINPIAFVLIAVFTYQAITKKTTSGIIIAIVFLIINLYLTLALISEAREFDVINNNWTQLVIVGSLYIGTNLVLGVIMLIKYAKKINEIQLQQNNI